MKTTKISDTKRYEVIKLGIDAHARDYHVCRQVEGATPQAVQKMNLQALLRFVAKQLEQAKAVHTCYEAGGFGYHLHRKLTSLGAINVVVQPQDWDEWLACGVHPGHGYCRLHNSGQGAVREGEYAG